MEPEELLEKLLKEGGIKNPMLMQANVYIGLNEDRSPRLNCWFVLESDKNSHSRIYYYIGNVWRLIIKDGKDVRHHISIK